MLLNWLQFILSQRLNYALLVYMNRMEESICRLLFFKFCSFVWISFYLHLIENQNAKRKNDELIEISTFLSSFIRCFVFSFFFILGLSLCVRTALILSFEYTYACVHPILKLINAAMPSRSIRRDKFHFALYACVASNRIYGSIKMVYAIATTTMLEERIARSICCFCFHYSIFICVVIRLIWYGLEEDCTSLSVHRATTN